ncbi:MAG: hypothetical protein JWQ78_2212 [Sediminibacterium sp.]|nr:hypothetical protein [Sediminibacterium sp.]
MRKILLPCLLACVTLSCNTATEKTTVKTDSTSAKPVYAYTIEKPDNWVMGDSKNTAIALSALKAFETNKLDELMNYFADTVTWKTDYVDAKLPKDSLGAIFKAMWNETASMQVDMHDFESVVSKDKKDEYVTLWYKTVVKDKKGKTDSAEWVNDMKIVNGKIVALDEATRHFPVKK